MTVDTGKNQAPVLRRAGRWTRPGHARHLSAEAPRVTGRRVTDRHGRRWRGRNPWPPVRAGLAVLVLLVLPVVAFSAVARVPSDGRVPHPPSAGGASCRHHPTGMARAHPVRSSSAAGLLPAPQWFDVDGDGCRDGVTVSGGIVAVHGRNGTEAYAVGEAGDHVMIGDWDCDGVATPLVHRPADGLVHEFDRWPVASEAVRPSTRPVPRGGTATLITEDGCHRLSVADPVTGRPLPGWGTREGS